MKKTSLDNFYSVLENMTDEQYLKFYFEWFGTEKMFDDIRESVFSFEDAKEALKVAGGIIANQCETCGRSMTHYAIVKRKRVYYCDNCES
jgi:hypothetical protein